MKLKIMIGVLFFGVAHLKAQRTETVRKPVKIKVPTEITFILTPNNRDGSGSRNFYIGNNTLFEPGGGSNNYYIEAGSSVLRNGKSWVGPIVLLNDGEKTIENPIFTNQDGRKFTYPKESIVEKQELTIVPMQPEKSTAMSDKASIVPTQTPQYRYEGYERDLVFMQERMPHPTIPNAALFTERATDAASRFFHAFNFVGLPFGTLAEMMGLSNFVDLERKDANRFYYTIPNSDGASGALYFGFIVNKGVIMALDFGVTP